MSLIEDDEVEQSGRDFRDALVGMTEDLGRAHDDVYAAGGVPVAAALVGAEHFTRLRIGWQRARLLSDGLRRELIGDLIFNNPRGRDDEDPFGAQEVRQEARHERLADAGRK